MADAPHASSNPWEPILFILGLVVILVALAWARGGLSNINTQGFFIAPPLPQPVAPDTQNPQQQPQQ